MKRVLGLIKRELALAVIFILGFGWLYLMEAPAWGAAVGGWVLVAWADIRTKR